MRPGLSAGHVRYLQYRPAVDGLRGVAVLAVLGFHAFPEAISGGYVGVDVFFVISGFLITGIILRELHAGRFSIASFYWRRVRRLFPSLVLVLAVTVGLGWLILLPDEFQRLGKHVAAASVFLANAAYWQESGYFDTTAEFKPLLHLWSLGIEEQFYLLWPALLILLWKRRWVLVTALAILVLSSFALCLTIADQAPVGNFYSPASRFWELGSGCLLAVTKEYFDNSRINSAASPEGRWSKQMSILPIAGLVCILGAVAFIDGSTVFPGLATLLPVFGTLLVLASPDHAGFMKHVMAWRPLVWVGLISYALYLWHWPLLAFANVLQMGPPSLMGRWALLALSFALATLTYRYVEVPVRQGNSRRWNLILPVAVAAAGLAGVAIYAMDGIASRFDVDVQGLHHEARLDDICRQRIQGNPAVNYCRATSTAPPTVMFLGDSRAQAVYEGAAPLLAPDRSVMLLGRGGCPPVLNVRIEGYDLNEQDCEDVWNMFVRYVHDAKPEVVVLVANGSFLLTNPDIHLFRHGMSKSESKTAVLQYGIHSLVSELEKSSRVILLGEWPTFATPPSCFLRKVNLPSNRCTPEIPRREVENSLRDYIGILTNVRSMSRNARFVDTVAVLCSEMACTQRPHNHPILYSDATHLSPAGGRALIIRAGFPELVMEN